MIKVRIKKIPKAKTGYQVQGALVNDVPAMGGADYNAYIGQPKLMESKYITAVPREEANVEAEDKETVYGDLNGDGMPEHKIIKGKRHSEGGVPLNLPEDTFIYSDTRGMRIKDCKILTMFGKPCDKKSYTPAELAKQYDIQKYRKILEDPETDSIDRKTAELMLKKYVVKLGCLALAQESMKGFPQGVPVVAKPCLESMGLTEKDILPNEEITGLNEQLKKQKEKQEQPNPEAQEAVEMNQGQPVAQPSMEEMMMYGGGMRRLRRAQEGMQQPSPEEMAMMQQQDQQQGGGQDQMTEILQEVQAALQRGAQPEEVVMSLLQNGLPPEAIVQIFTQLGASQEEVAGLIQQVMSQAQGGQEQMMGAPEQQMMEQAPPMAQYGMTLGGYDMPFYDMPEAEYGMAMGANPSNYQGRPKRIPASGPFSLAKAQDGIVIDASNMSEDQLNRAIWDAKQKDPNAKITVTRKDPNTGKVKSQNVTGGGFYIPEGKDIQNLNGFPDTPSGRLAASQYMLIEQNLQDPTVRAEIIKNTRSVIEDPKAWKGKNATAVDPNAKWSVKYGSEPTDDQIINAALTHQKRNLMFRANDVDPQLFSDVGNKLDDVDKVLSEGYINPATGNPYTRAEATAALKKLNDAGFTSVAAMSKQLGVPLDPAGKDRLLQQATMHGYAKSYQDFQKGAYDNNPDAKYAMDNFLGNVSLIHNGAADETSMGALYGPIGNKISPLDDKYDYANNTWYGQGRGNYTTYGDTTAGHQYMVGKRRYDFEDIPEEGGPCQCDDPNKPNYKPKDDKGNCTCEQTPPEKCPCQKSDGTIIEMTPDANGNCPCSEDMSIDYPGQQPEWWLQDTIKTTGAFGDLMGLKKRMPLLQTPKLGTPRPHFIDPNFQLATQKSIANSLIQGTNQFAGAQQGSARSSSIFGQQADAAAKILSQYDTANVGVANDFELKANDIINRGNTLRAATGQRAYDLNTIANQQFDNAKLAMRNNLRNYYANAITNKEKTDALNQMFPNYKVHPAVGGRMEYNPTYKSTDTTASNNNDAYWTQRKKCEEAGASNPDECARNAINSTKMSNTNQSTANAEMIKQMYPSKFGGPVYADGGFVYIDTWTPFIM